MKCIERIERIEQSLSGGGVGLDDVRSAVVPTATAEMEETREQLAALEKRITDIDPEKIMTSRLHFCIVAFLNFQNISDA